MAKMDSFLLPEYNNATSDDESKGQSVVSVGRHRHQASRGNPE